MKSLKHILVVSSYILYVIAGIYIAIYLYMCYEAGLFSCVEALYGKGGICIAGIAIIAGLLSPIYLKAIISNKKRVYFLSLLICVSIGVALITGYTNVTSYFREFSVEKWEKYSNERYLMIDDLRENHHMIGKNINDVIKVLGIPDEYNDKKATYQYDYGIIILNIESNTVVSIEYTNYF